ncbi:cadherin-like domain-containing protein [Paraglaciecola aestuariivivens]
MQHLPIKNIASLSVVIALMGCGSDDDYQIPVNTPPVAVSVNLITQADVPINDQVSGTDADGDPLSYSVASEPTLGSLTLNANGDFTYQPNETVTGTDSFSFTVSDNAFGSDTATVFITIEKQQVSFASYSRNAYAQSETDKPLPTNGREFTQDVTDPNAYDDLLENP